MEAQMQMQRQGGPGAQVARSKKSKKKQSQMQGVSGFCILGPCKPGSRFSFCLFLLKKKKTKTP
jgi:hypothetical protein